MLNVLVLNNLETDMTSLKVLVFLLATFLSNFVSCNCLLRCRDYYVLRMFIWAIFETSLPKENIIKFIYNKHPTQNHILGRKVITTCPTYLVFQYWLAVCFLNFMVTTNNEKMNNQRKRDVIIQFWHTAPIKLRSFLKPFFPNAPFSTPSKH